jgi:hypothetical protein
LETPLILQGVLFIIGEGMFRRRTIAIGVEPRYTIKVGHDRYGNLIIKELRVSGDNLDDVIDTLKNALNQFNEIKVEQALNIDG